MKTFINKHRKPIQFACAFILIVLWAFSPNPLPLSSRAYSALSALGALLVAVSALGRLVASLSIESYKNAKVVDTELYSVTRNPLYLFSFALVVGIGLIIGRIDILVLAVAFFWICYYPVILHEEGLLEGLFGEAYTDYKAKVPRIVPDFRLWRMRDRAEVDMKLALKAVGDASVSLSAIALLVVINLITKH